MIYEDEASFQQSPTLCRTWAPKNSQPKIPSSGLRNSQKIFGGLSLYDGRFVYRHQTEYFNAVTYLRFLDEVLLPFFYRRNHRVFLIQDNAGYHKKPEVLEWFEKEEKKIRGFSLPPYSPEFNAAERIWRYTRKGTTHNHYFASVAELCEALFSTFADMQKHPDKIRSLITSFL